MLILCPVFLFLSLQLLIDSGVPVILIRENPEAKAAIGTFDYADLNAYLLLVVGLVHPGEEHVTSMRELARKAREGKEIPLRDVKNMGLNVPITTLPPGANLMRAVEIFGGGIHRIIVTKQDTNEVVGIFSQWRLVKFLWENGQSFPVIDHLYPRYLADLKIGSQQVISIKYVLVFHIRNAFSQLYILTDSIVETSHYLKLWN